MNLEREELLNVIGGISVTGTLINSLSKGISTLFNLGKSLGTSIRYSTQGKLCPI